MEERWLSLYERLVNTDTGFEVSIDEKLDRTSFLADILSDMGFEVRRGRASHVAFRGDPPYITFIGHLDTVFKAGEPERRPFQVRGNEVRGPGVADMKGGVILLLMALERILEDFKGSSIGVVLNVDEEIGSGESAEDHLSMAEKSKFCLSFETGRGKWKVVTGRKGIASLMLKVKGRSGHASLPDSGANAVVELASKVQRVASLRFGDLTVVPTIISGGTKSNVIPDRAELFCDVRFSDFSEIDILKGSMRDLVGEKLVEGTITTYEVEIRRMPMREMEVVGEIIENVSKRLRKEIERIHVGGGGDAAFYTFKGVPAVDGLGIVGEKIHSEDEVAYLDSVESRLAISLGIFEEIVRRG